MAKRFELEMFGLPVIMRHDYEIPGLKEKLQEYQSQSYKQFKHFLTNVPGFKYETFLDVGCGDDWVVKQAKEDFAIARGIDLYVEENEYPDVVKGDWYKMKSSFGRYNAVFINHSLEHSDSPYRLMEQVSALQEKNDALFVAVPDGNSPFGYSITSSTTHFSCITEGYLATTLQRFGYNVAVERREFRVGAPELWAFAIKH